MSFLNPLFLFGLAAASVPILIVFAFGMKYYIEGLTPGAIKS